MKMCRNLIGTAFGVLAIVALASTTNASPIPVTGWIVHNGTSTVGGTASNPTFTPGDNVTLMAPFSDISLANDGDSIEAKTTLTMNSRTGTGVNSLNTQLRFALLDDSVNGTLTAGDFPNVGFTIEYANLNSGTPPQSREQTSLTQTAPFVSPTSINNGTLDANGGSIQGADPGPVTFDIKITRNGGALDMVGSISGTDSVTSLPYLSTFGWTGHTSTNFPLNGPFSFNRLAVFLGGNVNAATASLSDSSVNVVPEPTSLILVAGMALSGVFMRKRTRRGAGQA
ncbi:MAG TPA: PEP-CTERM sorting domain-containing protein [Lacipirellulaceae bacterium]|nr:PEP-CTERM sorting domain-containing protein [Lacipirellulaceae bacterium]